MSTPGSESSDAETPPARREDSSTRSSCNFVSHFSGVPVAGGYTSGYDNGGGTVASVARVTEISSRSETSFEDAVKVGIERASQTLRGLRSGWIKEQEVSLDPSSGEITGYEVIMKVTFVLDEGQ